MYFDIKLGKLVPFLEYAGLCVRDRTHYENMKMSFENAKKSLCKFSETPPILQTMDKNRGFPNVI